MEVCCTLHVASSGCRQAYQLAKLCGPRHACNAQRSRFSARGGHAAGTAAGSGVQRSWQSRACPGGDLLKTAWSMDRLRTKNGPSPD
eukprot:365948-Chlamydomonas_euryale.AAC.3